VRRLAVKLLYFGRTSLRGLRSSPVTTAVAVVTIGVSLVLVGAFWLLLQNMQELLKDFGDDLHVTAYLEDDLEAGAQRKLEKRILDEVKGVESVRAVSKAEALERFRAGVGKGTALLEGLDENPLPASLEILLVPDWRKPERMRIVAESVKSMPGISDLAAGLDWVDGYLRAIALVRGTGIGLGLILALATLLIITNTIRLAVFARRDELEILWLVGASRSFMNTPFLVEGFLQGVVGGAVAVVLLYGVFRLVLPGFEFALEVVLGAAPRFFTVSEVLVLVGGGAVLGLIGSLAAVTGSARP
jgi:cell division transport system permease protein